MKSKILSATLLFLVIIMQGFREEPKLTDKLEVNKDNCGKLYLKDNSFSEEYKEKFEDSIAWRIFAKSCHDFDKTKPSPYKSWTFNGAE